MKKKLELIVRPKAHKRKEFNQSLNLLIDKLQKYCSSLMIDESEDGLTLTILAGWVTVDQMRTALRSEEFFVLSGAIRALCEKTVIRLDDKQFSNHISKLSTLC
jgi:hypothetical protein